MNRCVVLQLSKKCFFFPTELFLLYSQIVRIYIEAESQKMSV